MDGGLVCMWVVWAVTVRKSNIIRRQYSLSLIRYIARFVDSLHSSTHSTRLLSFAASPVHSDGRATPPIFVLCSGYALVMLWLCSGYALVMLWLCSGL